MNPRQELFEGKVIIIRPLCYVEERTIRRFARENGFIKDDGRRLKMRATNRMYLKNFIKEMEKRCPGVKSNIFNSIARVKADYIGLQQEEMTSGEVKDVSGSNKGTGGFKILRKF